MSVSAKDRQIESLKRRNHKDRESYERTIAAKNAELRALRDAWELLDTYPALENFLRWLHKIRDASSNLRSASYDSRSAPGFGDPTGDQARRPNSDRRRIADVNESLRFWTGKLEEKLGPKGPLLDEEIPDVSKPRCFNPDCPARLRPQGFDLEICADCKVAFTEFRDPHTKCWRSECAEKLNRSRGHLGACPE